ncbi:MAG: O-antigen ligase family protein [Anaerolineales bacterium]|nr:O-antigen ligase family protein [Anaerolineales bacterium]
MELSQQNHNGNQAEIEITTRTHSLSRRFVIFLRVMIVLAMLAGAGVIGVVGGGLNPFIAVAVGALPFLLVGLERLLAHFEWMPILIVILATFVPLSIPTGTGSNVVDSLAATSAFFAIWVVKMLIIDKRISFINGKVTKPLLGYIIAVVISIVWSNLFLDWAVKSYGSFIKVQLASAVVMIMLPGAFLLVANNVKQELHLKIMVWLVLLGGAFALVRNYGNIPLPVNQKGLFPMWAVALAYAMALFNEKLPKLVRGALFLYTGVWVVWGFVLNISWVAGWFPVILVIGIITVLRSWKLVLLFVLIGLLVFALNADYYLGKVLRDEQEESGETRLAAWLVSFRVVRYHWVFGTGPAGYTAYYMTYYPSEAMATHNNYLDILAQTGVVGLTLYLLFFIYVARLGLHLALRLRKERNFLSALAMATFAGTIGGIVMMGFGDWMVPFAYTQSIEGFDFIVHNWMFMGAVVVIEQLVNKRDAVLALEGESSES